MFSNLQESWSKGSHAAREVGNTIFCDLFVFIFLVTIVGQLVKMLPPPPTEDVSAHH